LLEGFEDDALLVGRNADSRIRSKAALILGRTRPTASLIQRLMRDEDARVRANFVEGLWNSEGDHCALFREVLQDSHQRVVGNALIGLHRVGKSREVIQHVTRLVRHSDPHFRATAAWVMGQTGEARFSAVLRQMAYDQDPLVRRNALSSLERISAAHSTAPPESK